MLWILLVLFIIGLSLLVLELFLPGAIVGVMGGLALLGVIILSWINYGIVAGVVSMVAVMAGAWMAIVLGGKWLPNSRFGNKMVLDTEIRGISGPAGRDVFLGKTGKTLTLLRPVGVIEIEGERLDAMAEFGTLSKGTPIRVVRVAGSNLIVNRIESTIE